MVLIDLRKSCNTKEISNSRTDLKLSVIKYEMFDFDTTIHCAVGNWNLNGLIMFFSPLSNVKSWDRDWKHILT